MKIKSVLLSGVATVAAASLAQAGDLPSKAAAAAPAPNATSAINWTGFSIGLGGGGQFLQSQDYVNANGYAVSYNNNYSITNDVNQKTDLGKLSGFGTVEVAADYQASSLVMGVFANYNFGTSKVGWDNWTNSCYTNGNQYNEPQCYSGASVEVGNSWDVGGRLGVLLNDRTLVYGLGGYSWAKIKTAAYNNTYNNLNSNDNAWFYSEAVREQTRGGWMAGAGLEYAFSNNVTLKTEYRHYDYGTVRVSETYSNRNDWGNSSMEHSSKVTVDSVRALLSYKF